MPVGDKPLIGFFAELKRRRVLHIGGAYIAGAWLGAEVLGFLLEQFVAPDWMYRLLAIAFVIGFPITMILAWFIQVQPDGAWALDPARGDYKTIAAATLLGALITALLSWWLVLGKLAEPVFRPMPNSIAVLPIDGGDNFYSALTTGLESADDLTLTRLGSIELPDDLQQFGKQYELEWLSLGHLVQDRDHTRIEMQLFNVMDGEVTWSHLFDLHGLTSRAATARVVNGLLKYLGMAALQPQDIARTDDNEAFHMFIEGEQHASREDPELLDKAIAAFEQALAIDSGYAQAHIRLADSLYERALRPGTTDEDRGELEARARTAAQRAYALDPGSGPTLSLVGMAESMRQLRIQAFERALELDPDHDRSYFRLARELKQSGNLEDAEILVARAIRLRPGSARYRLELADILERQGLPASEAH
jgi:tetratricopeptide (TPR) repeat protein